MTAARSGRLLPRLVIDGLEVRVCLFQESPYDEDIISTARLYEMLVEAASEAAGRIARRVRAGRYKKDSFATFIMSPTMPVGALPHPRYILGAVLIGPDAERLLKNAWAKIVAHMETGQDCGIAVFTQPHRMAKGRFNWGLTALVDGTLGGGSGLNQYQDKAEVIMMIADLNEQIDTTFAEWEAAFVEAAGKRPSWFTSDGSVTDDEKFENAVRGLVPIIGEYILAA